MAKNSKNRRRHVDAKTRNRTKGYKGPARTTKQHTKRNTWYARMDGKIKANAPAAQTDSDAS